MESVYYNEEIANDNDNERLRAETDDEYITTMIFIHVHSICSKSLKWVRSSLMMEYFPNISFCFLFINFVSLWSSGDVTKQLEITYYMWCYHLEYFT